MKHYTYKDNSSSGSVLEEAISAYHLKLDVAIVPVQEVLNAEKELFPDCRLDIEPLRRKI